MEMILCLLFQTSRVILGNHQIQGSLGMKLPHYQCHKTHVQFGQLHTSPSCVNMAKLTATGKSISTGSLQTGPQPVWRLGAKNCSPPGPPKQCRQHASPEKVSDTSTTTPASRGSARGADSVLHVGRGVSGPSLSTPSLAPH